MSDNLRKWMPVIVTVGGLLIGGTAGWTTGALKTAELKGSKLDVSVYEMDQLKRHIRDSLDTRDRERTNALLDTLVKGQRRVERTLCRMGQAGVEC